MGWLQLEIRVVAVILMKEAGLKHGILNCTDRSNRLGANDLLLLHVIGMQRHLQFIAQHREMGCTFHNAVNALNPIAWRRCGRGEGERASTHGTPDR